MARKAPAAVASPRLQTLSSIDLAALRDDVAAEMQRRLAEQVRQTEELRSLISGKPKPLRAAPTPGGKVGKGRIDWTAANAAKVAKELAKGPLTLRQIMAIVEPGKEPGMYSALAALVMKGGVIKKGETYAKGPRFLK